MKSYLRLLSVLVVFCWHPCLADKTEAVDVLVVAHPGVVENTLTQQQIEDIYQGHRGKWSDGRKIKVAMLKSGAVHESFCSGYVSMTPKKLKSLWKKVIFSGNGMPPKILHDEAELVSYVAATPGAVGYISPQTPHDGVKILVVTP